MFLRKVTNSDYSLGGGVGAFVMLSLNKVPVVDRKYTLFVRLHVYTMEQFNGTIGVGFSQ